MPADVVALQTANHELAQTVADLQCAVDGLQQQQPLQTQASLNASRGQWDAARFRTQSAEATLVALNPGPQGRVHRVPVPTAGGGSSARWCALPHDPPLPTGERLVRSSIRTAGRVRPPHPGGRRIGRRLGACGQRGPGLNALRGWAGGTLDGYVDVGARARANGILEVGTARAGVATDRGIDPLLRPNHVMVSCMTEDRRDTTHPVTDAQFSSVLYAAREATQRDGPLPRYVIHHADPRRQSLAAVCPGGRRSGSRRCQARAHALGLNTVAP